jgi:hypothetical protein
MAENAQTISIDPNQGQQGPTKEEIDLQKKVWLKDHEMRKADIIARSLSIGMHKDSKGILFVEEQRSILETRLFNLLDGLDND